MQVYLKYILVVLGIAMLSFIISYCGDSSVGSIGRDDEIADIYRYCKNSAQCEKDEECINHKCVKKKARFCRTNNDCNPDEECINNKCVQVTDITDMDISYEDIYIDVEYTDIISKQPKIKAEPEELDFGALRYGEKAEKSIFIKNIGDSNVKVFSIQLEQGENKNVFSFKTDYKYNTLISPSDSFEIIISCTQDDAEADIGYLLISSDDENLPLLKIKLFNSYKDEADVHVVYIDSENMEIEYPSQGDKNNINIDLGNIPIGEKKNQVVKIINNAEYGILLLKNFSKDPMNLNDKNINKFSSSLSDPISGSEISPPYYLSGGEYINLVVEYDANKEAIDDKYSVSLRFNDLDVNNDGDKSEEGVLIIEIKAKAGYIPPKLSIVDLNGIDILSSGIDFGEVERGETEKRFFKICNTGGGILEIDKRSGLINKNFLLIPENPEGSLKYGQCMDIEINFTPLFVGNVKDIMVVYSNDPKNPQVSFNISAQGIDTEIKVEPLTIDFGGVSINTDATPYPVKISNIGYGKMVLFDISLSSGSSSDFSLSGIPQNFPVYLNSSDNIVFYVNFRPSSIGNKNGAIEIKSSDRENSNVIIKIFGAGSNCDPDHMDCNNNPLDGCEIDITSSIEHCGGCNRLCNPANANGKCINKICIIESCKPNFQNCNNDVIDGCEADLKNSPTTCGSCYNNCGENSLCIDGKCSCKSGFKDCDQNLNNGCETNITSDLNNCGDCSKRCATDNTFLNQCENGECKIVTCALGFMDCDGIVQNGCEVDIRNDNNNCGGCKIKCNQNATCKNGECQCLSGYANCNNKWDDGCEINLNSNQTCGTSCSNITNCNQNAYCSNGSCLCLSPYENCNGLWSDGCEININTDVNNCGKCKFKCELPNTDEVTCNLGQCKVVKCKTNYGNCDNQDYNGCETNLSNDANNCGSCNNKCNQNAQCINGACQCNNGYLNCNDQWADGCEVNKYNDPYNCNGCGNVCNLPNVASHICNMGVCNIGICKWNYANCDGIQSNGCEINLNTDPNNCGTCNNKCNQNAYCSNGNCFCNTNYYNCNSLWSDGCEINISSDPYHCGDCYTNCYNLSQVSSASCNYGQCVINSCNTPYGNCDGYVSNGCEINLSNDVNNCGICGRRCGQNAQCVNGNCQCISGYLNCNNDWNDGCELFVTEDVPDDNFVDSNCDGVDGDKTKAIFVDTSSGSDSNSGNIDSPVKTITKGIQLASSYNPPKYLIISEGNYNETFNLAAGVSLYGGYSKANGWKRSNSYIVNIYPNSNGIRATNINIRTDIDRVNIYAADATSAGASSYGMFIQNSSNIYINRCTIRGGKGGDGANGANGTPGPSNNPSTMNGAPGQPGCEDSSGFCDTCSRPRGGAGGTSVCGMHGGKGGDAGHDSNYGYAGSNGIGPYGTGGAGGAGGPCCRGNQAPLANQYGIRGSDGANGSNGAAGIAVGTLTATGYIATNSGGDGENGVNGAGGGGGGGGGGGVADCDSYGSSGGGGGAGGCGGTGGKGGGGGGASIGIYLSSSNISISFSNIGSKNGGNGGSGGVGGWGSAGGAGGAGGYYGGSGEQDDGSMGADGGAGGKGGDGGYGGGGGGGPSVCIMKYGSSNVTLNSVTFTRGAGGTGGWSGGATGWNGISVDIYP